MHTLMGAISGIEGDEDEEQRRAQLGTGIGIGIGIARVEATRNPLEL